MFFLEETLQCTNICPEGKVEGTPDDFALALERLRRPEDNSEAADEFLIAAAESAKGICVTEVPEIVRPSGEISIKPNFCICKDRKVATTNYDQSCPAKCASTSEQQSQDYRIFGDVSVGKNILLNENLKNLNGWCKATIADGRVNPNCSMEATDGKVSHENLNIVVNNNTFEGIITSLPLNVTYKLQIKETGSGSNAESDYIQFKLIFPTDPLPNTGPLRVMPINLYTCINETSRTQNQQTGDISNGDHSLIHLHYAENTDPLIVPHDFSKGDNASIYCHDREATGVEFDDPSFIRLQLRRGHAYMWDVSDPRFVAKNNVPQINTLIAQEVANRGGSLASSTFFSIFQLPTSILDLIDSKVQNLGFIMIPWVDESTQTAYCPGNTEYNSNNPIFNAIRDFVSVPTEGIFIGVAPRTTSSNQYPDFMLISEGQLKKIWFYFDENNNETRAPDNGPLYIRNKQMHFYWPPDESNPTVLKEGHQGIYSVRTLQDAFSSGSAQAPTSVATHDKRFGCIPKVD